MPLGTQLVNACLLDGGCRMGGCCKGGQVARWRLLQQRPRVGLKRASRNSKDGCQSCAAHALRFLRLDELDPGRS